METVLSWYIQAAVCFSGLGGTIASDTYTGTERCQRYVDQIKCVWGSGPECKGLANIALSSYSTSTIQVVSTSPLSYQNLGYSDPSFYVS